MQKYKDGFKQAYKTCKNLSPKEILEYIESMEKIPYDLESYLRRGFRDGLIVNYNLKSPKEYEFKKVKRES